MHNLSIAQQNVNNSHTYLNNLPLLMDRHFDIYVLSEPPKTASNLNTGLTTYSVSSGRSAIIILNQSLSTSFVVDESNTYVTCIKVDEHNIKIYSVYYPPASSSFADFAKNFVTPVLAKKSMRTLVLGDFNATTPLLNDQHSTRGTELTAFFLPCEWSLLNAPGIPTRKTGSTCIDWSLASLDFSSHFTWACSQHDQSISDHCLITITSDFQQQYHKKDQVGLFIDSRLFISELRNHDVDEVASHITQYIKKAVESSARVATRKRKKPFYNEQCLRSKQEVNRLRRLVKKRGHRCPQLIVELEQANRTHSLNVKSAKETHWTNRVAKCKSIGDIHALLRSNRLKPAPVAHIISGDQRIDEPNALSRTALNHFYPESIGTSSLLSFAIDGPRDTAITQHEVNCALAAQRTNTPGEDQVNTHLVLVINHSVPSLLLKTYNRWFHEERMPNEMKEALITLIKKNNEVSCHLGNLRPISLVNVLAKIYERILYARMAWFLSSTTSPSVEQFGFTTGRSCEDALRALATARLSRLNSKDVIFSLDVKGAFNNIAHPSIMREITRLGFSRSIINIIADYLMNRKMYVSLSKQENVIMTRGVPQGTILGPLLFRITFEVFIRNMKQLLSAAQIDGQIIAFADDVSIILSLAPITPHFSQIATWLLSQTNTVLRNIGLELNLNKVLIMSPALIGTRVNIDNHQIQVSATTNFLGLCLQSPGCFSKHISNKLDEIEAKIDTLKHYIATRSLNLSSRITLIKSSIHSIITYGSDLILAGAFPAELMNRFLNIDRKIATHLYGTSFTASYASVASFIGSTSLMYQLILSSEVKKLQVAQTTSRIYEGRSSLPPATPPQNLAAIRFARASTEERISHPKDLTLAIYTDGSRTSDNLPNTCAFVTWSPASNLWEEFYFKLPEHSSAYQCERHAIFKAIAFVEENCSAGHYHILSDSYSVLRALSAHQPRDPLIRDMQQRYHYCFYSRKIIHFTWVKGHAGIRGNERADQACVSARLSSAVTEFVPLTLASLKKEATSFADEKYIETTRSLFQDNSKSLVNSAAISLHRSFRVNYYSAALYSNRAPTRSHLKKLNLSDSDLCDCGQIQSVRHLLISCPLIREAFQDIYSSTAAVTLFLLDESAILDSISFHGIIAKIAGRLLSWLENSNGHKYEDIKHLAPQTPSSATPRKRTRSKRGQNKYLM